MVVSNRYTEFYHHARKAYDRFSSHRIPFSAIKLNLPGEVKDEAGLKKGLLGKFRKTDPVIAQEKGTVTVLFHNTPVDDAVLACKRIAPVLSDTVTNGKAGEPSRATVEVIGTRADSTEIFRAKFVPEKSYGAPSPSSGISATYSGYTRAGRPVPFDGRGDLVDIDV